MKKIKTKEGEYLIMTKKEFDKTVMDDYHNLYKELTEDEKNVENKDRRFSADQFYKIFEEYKEYEKVDGIIIQRKGKKPLKITAPNQFVLMALAVIEGTEFFSKY